jgi:hypothetical protein
MDGLPANGNCGRVSALPERPKRLQSENVNSLQSFNSIYECMFVCVRPIVYNIILIPLNFSPDQKKNEFNGKNIK